MARPSLLESDRVLIVPDPPGLTPRLAECRLVHLDPTSERLVVTPIDADEPLSPVIDAAVLVLVIRPGEPLFARSCCVEARIEAARWLVLVPTGTWQQLERRLVERTIVTLPAEGHRYITTGGGLAVRGIVRDLSMTGFCFESEMSLALGELLVLDARPPGDEVLRIRGQVVRIVRPQSNPHGLWLAGCQFWGVLLADQERIARFVSASI